MTRFRALALAVLTVSLPALAQGAPSLAGIPDPDENVLAVVGLIVQLAQGGQWLPAVMVGLFLAVWAFRKYVLKLVPGKVGDWLRTKLGGYVINFTFALAGGFSSALLKGVSFSVAVVAGIIGAAVSFAFGASGLNELWKDLTAKPTPVEPAPVTSVSEAVTQLNRVGPPAE